MKISIGFSPCPNDTFIFDSLVNKSPDDNFEFEVHLEDVETLNRWALEKRLDVTKLSYGVWPLVQHEYTLLDSGSALGKGVGPLLISKNRINKENIEDCLILIPGEHTTAHMLFTHAFPKAKNKKFLRYNEIEEALLNSNDDKTAGVIIHEKRFTYKDKGLQLTFDLGKYWEDETQSPIPLGGIVARKSLGKEMIARLDALIKKSIEESWKAYPLLSNYIKSNAQEMSEDVMRKHIELYVNDFSASLGEKGKNAVDKFLSVYEQMQLKN